VIVQNNEALTWLMSRVVQITLILQYQFVSICGRET